MADHGHGGGHAPAHGSGGSHGASSGGSSHGGGGGSFSLGWFGFLFILFLFIVYLYIPNQKNKKSQSSPKIEWQEDQVFTVEFTGEYGEFITIGHLKNLQFAPASEPIDVIDNFGYPYHADLGIPLGILLEKNFPTKYAIKIKSSNGKTGKMSYATLKKK